MSKPRRRKPKPSPKSTPSRLINKAELLTLSHTGCLAEQRAWQLSNGRPAEKLVGVVACEGSLVEHAVMTFDEVRGALNPDWHRELDEAEAHPRDGRMPVLVTMEPEFVLVRTELFLGMVRGGVA